MKYRQSRVQKIDCMASKVELKIDGRWIEGKLLDRDGREMPLPCEVKAGETYCVEVQNDHIL